MTPQRIAIIVIDIGNRVIKGSLSNKERVRESPMATKSKAATAVVDDDEDVEEVEEADTETAEDAVWGVRDLIALVKTKTGKEYKPREVRTQLRAMARKGQINREIIAGNKTRYAWSGPDDPEVKAFIKAVKGGEIEANKKAALDKLKADKAKKTAASDKAGTKGKGTKAAAPPADDDEDEDD